MSSGNCARTAKSTRAWRGSPIVEHVLPKGLRQRAHAARPDFSEIPRGGQVRGGNWVGSSDVEGSAEYAIAGVDGLGIGNASGGTVTAGGASARSASEECECLQHNRCRTLPPIPSRAAATCIHPRRSVYRRASARRAPPVLAPFIIRRSRHPPIVMMKSIQYRKRHDISTRVGGLYSPCLRDPLFDALMRTLKTEMGDPLGENRAKASHPVVSENSTAAILLPVCDRS